MSSGGTFVDVEVAATSPEELRIKVPAGTATYSITITDPVKTVSTASFVQQAGSTPLLTLDTTSTTPGNSFTIGLTQTTVLSASPSKVYVYNILNEDELTEIPSGDLLLNSPYVEFPYTFRTGKYGIKVWYDAYGWGEVSAFFTVAASADFTASATTSSYLGGQITVSGAFISDKAELSIGGMKGKVISVTDSQAIF